MKFNCRLFAFVTLAGGIWHTCNKAVRSTIWRETLVVGKFDELSAKLPLAKNLANCYMKRAPCN